MDSNVIIIGLQKKYEEDGIQEFMFNNERIME